MSSLPKRKEKKILQATFFLENETINSISSSAVFASSYILMSVHSKCKRSWYVILVCFFYEGIFFPTLKKPKLYRVSWKHYSGMQILPWELRRSGGLC